MSAWVDQNQRQEFENKLMGSSGVVFQSIALLPTSKDDADHVAGRAPAAENSATIKPRLKKSRLTDKTCPISFEQNVERYLDKASRDTNQTTGQQTEVNKTTFRKTSLTCNPSTWPFFSAGQGELDRIRKTLFSPTFNALDYSPDDLTILLGEIFIQLELDKDLKTSWATVQTLILSARAGMPNNLYHNWTHVADVVQKVFSLATASGLLAELCGKQRLALFLAALFHDIEHPGVTAGYLVSAQSRMAAWYKNDPGLLEKHHSIRAFELLICKDIPLLQHLPADDRVNLRSLVRD
eukprot:CAMPEP_0172188310 /NCGR_PEP_ID=MMETSP1050-20130122/21844_1 /TAXON_ID=233186 /ORGANISM="Cryptomonas curvata, Strain CCAP979/52" /LENGTH=294 /DNA_ID=CAMNT_0012862773 /DNA_START=213 /DNA_END=1094 /DNA_ORIENTATION=+